MTITEALLTNSAYGYPARGDHRRHTPHILAVVHQTATNPYDGQAMVLRNQRNGAGFAGNTATYYIDPDGAAVHAVDGTRFASWCSAPKSITYLCTGRASIATVKRHFASGYNPNECVWEQFECVGTGTEPWTAPQFETVALLIAARAKLSGLPINRETVVPHRDFDTVNRPSDPWPAATREDRMAKLIFRARSLASSAPTTTGADMALLWKVTKHQGGTLTIKGTGHSAIRLRDGALIPQADGSSRVYDTEMQLAVPYRGTGLERQNGYQIGDDACCLLATDVVAVPNAAPEPPATTLVTVTTAIGGVLVNSFTKAV